MTTKTRTVRKVFGIAAAAVMTALALPQAAVAQSGSLTMSSYTYPTALGFGISGRSSVGAGGFNASYDRAGPTAPTSFVAYCIDLAQTFSWNTTFTATETTPVSLFGDFKAGALDRLYTQRFAETTNPVLSGAFQLAVWEILTESSAVTTYAGLGLGTGTFLATSGSSTARDTADTWLHSLGAGGSGGYTLTALVGPNNQDQMMATPVPEPETYLMLLAGLGLMGFAARLRQQDLAA